MKKRFDDYDDTMKKKNVIFFENCFLEIFQNFNFFINY